MQLADGDKNLKRSGDRGSASQIEAGMLPSPFHPSVSIPSQHGSELKKLFCWTLYNYNPAKQVHRDCLEEKTHLFPSLSQTPTGCLTSPP